MTQELLHESIQSLRFENLSFSHEGESGGRILENTTFDFPMNQTVWIRSSSGEGKSSLLQLMAGLLMAQKGAYFINEINMSDMSFEEFLPLRLKIGYGFDFGGLINNKTIFENIVFPLHYHRTVSVKKAEERVLHYLRFMGIEKYKDLRPAIVPGGIRKMTCLLRALVMHPEVLLLDDPSVGMHEETILRYFDLVKSIKAESNLRHIFVSSYDERLLRILGCVEVVLDEAKLFLHQPEEKWSLSG